jgi:hypothetical protein
VLSDPETREGREQAELSAGQFPPSTTWGTWRILRVQPTQVPPPLLPELDEDEQEPPLRRNVRWAPPKIQPSPVSDDGGDSEEENLALQELILPDTPLNELVQNT